jgi:putative transposase
MIGKKKRELRHRIKQTPFKKLIRAVQDKARETGSVVVSVSPYRNSKVCPIHFTLLRDDGVGIYCTVPAAMP